MKRGPESKSIRLGAPQNRRLRARILLANPELYMEHCLQINLRKCLSCVDGDGIGAPKLAKNLVRFPFSILFMSRKWIAHFSNKYLCFTCTECVRKYLLFIFIKVRSAMARVFRWYVCGWELKNKYKVHSAVKPVTDREIEVWKCKALEQTDTANYGKENPQQWANIGSNNEQNLVKPSRPHWENPKPCPPPPPTDGKHRRLSKKTEGWGHRGEANESEDYECLLFGPRLRK